MSNSNGLYFNPTLECGVNDRNVTYFLSLGLECMNEIAKTPLNALIRKLVLDGVITKEEAHDASIATLGQRGALVRYLIEEMGLNDELIAQKASTAFGIPLFDLENLHLDSIPNNLVDQELVKRHRVLPLSLIDDKICVAIADPTNLNALNDIKFHTDIRTEAVLLPFKKLDHIINDWLKINDNVGIDLGEIEQAELDELAFSDATTEIDKENSAIDEAPIVRFVNKVLIDAIKEGASDIHFEPYEKDFRVRFRTDGMLREALRPPRKLAARLTARLKVMAKLDISERRIPQDGRIKMTLAGNREIDFRVNSLPTLYGEKVVLRILDASNATIGIDALGYMDQQRKMYLDALSRPQGMILVTGPTGSGKTMSLYTGLDILNLPERNISTVEDPVEINMTGINQVHVNQKVGLGFAEALRSFLRQDPDVIMVGEIRDLETAEIAIKAAQTGHLVLSTLHTNNAAETITRLLNMGVPSYNLATSVDLIIAQRLARRLCSDCSVSPKEIPTKSLLDFGFTEEALFSANIKVAVGCRNCTDGYKGRIGVFEVLRISPSISKLIMESANSIAIYEQARKEGFYDLRQSALVKAAMGLISLEEVNRITIE